MGSVPHGVKYLETAREDDLDTLCSRAATPPQGFREESRAEGRALLVESGASGVRPELGIPPTKETDQGDPDFSVTRTVRTKSY